jgi:hypothetical protein
MAYSKALIFVIALSSIYIFFMVSFGIENSETKNPQLYEDTINLLPEDAGVLTYVTFPFKAVKLAIKSLFSFGTNIFQIAVLSVLFTILMLIIVFDYVIPIIRGD